jgi:hypothetical protein
MPPHKTPSQETNMIVALMESLEGLRTDLRTQTDVINKKLDTQADESKEIVKKIDANAVETRGELKDIRADISDMKVRLGEGSERMRNLRKDVDGVIGKCHTMHPAIPSTTALQRKQEESTVIHKKRTMPWWLPLLAGGALAFVGEKLARFVINGLADPPPAVTAQPSVPSAVPAATPGNNASTNSGAIHINLGQQKQ